MESFQHPSDLNGMSLMIEIKVRNGDKMRQILTIFFDKLYWFCLLLPDLRAPASTFSLSLSSSIRVELLYENANAQSLHLLLISQSFITYYFVSEIFDTIIWRTFVNWTIYTLCFVFIVFFIASCNIFCSDSFHHWRPTS